MDVLKNIKSYNNFDPRSEIRACLNLLSEIEDQFTPTDILRILGYTECNEMRSLVVFIAEENGFICKSRGRGITIFCIPF